MEDCYERPLKSFLLKANRNRYNLLTAGNTVFKDNNVNSPMTN